MSTAPVMSAVLICAGVRNGFLLKRSAATAATCGAAADVPKKGLSPPGGSVVMTPSNPARSGFDRVSGTGKKIFTGPCELKSSTVDSPGLFTPMAAAVNTTGTAACPKMLLLRILTVNCTEAFGSKQYRSSSRGCPLVNLIASTAPAVVPERLVV